MDKQPPLAGLDPADLLRQGMAEDTLAENGSPAFAPPPLEELTSLFPQFEILELIGQGGMGAVYKVRQKDLDRIVALKILPPAIGRSPEFSSRFTREARALAKLNHPGIVTIHEFGQQNGLYFILMEFVDGVSLAQLMKSGRIAPREALAIVPQICDALQYAHDQGIVHRDIKPENILLDRLGRVKVADFGIAKVVAAVGDDSTKNVGTPDSSDQTITGKIIGTPQYMAPEQIEHPSDVDHRADIYALGIVFYQMLTGELPGKDLEPPSRKVAIDVRLDEVVLRALEKEPELRYQQASVLKTQVETIAGNRAEQGEKNSNSRMVRLFEAVFDTRFTSPLAIRFINFSALGFLGCLGFLGYVALPGTRPLFALWGLFGLFGLLGFAFPIEKAHRRQQTGSRLDAPSVPVDGQESRFPRTAIWGALLLLVPVLFWSACAGASILIPLQISEGDRAALQGALYLAWFINYLLVVISVIGTTILGWIAVSQIRRSAGKLHGMWLAVFDGLLFPLLALGFLGVSLLSNYSKRHGSAADQAVQTLPAAQPASDELGKILTDLPYGVWNKPLAHYARNRRPDRQFAFLAFPPADDAWVNTDKLGLLGDATAEQIAAKANEGDLFVPDLDHLAPVRGVKLAPLDHRNPPGELPEAQGSLRKALPYQSRKEIAEAILRYAAAHPNDTWVRLEKGGRYGALGPDGTLVLMTAFGDGDHKSLQMIPVGKVTPSADIPHEPSFGPVIERVVTHEIHFDSGTDRQIDALYEDPMFVFAASTELASLTDRDWDQLSAAQLRSILYQQRQPARGDWNTDTTKFPVNLGFRTAGGTLGILQITGANESPPGVKIRYKLVGNPTAKVNGTLVLPKDFPEAQQAAVSKAALDLLATCGFSEGSSESEMFHAKNGAHIWITFPDGLAGDHPDDMLITFPLTSGSVWTRRGEKYERHAKFTPTAAAALSTALGHTPSAAFSAAAGLPEKEVAAAAKAWLAGIDAGNYAQSWKESAMFFRKAITENGWSAALAASRKPLGEMKSRKLLDAKSAKSLPGAPDGEYVVMQFETSFAAKDKAVETVTFMKESDGTWKAAGYFIR